MCDLKEITEKEALRFMENDFNQCFEQTRHYDNQISSFLKFIFAGYSTLIGLTIGFYQYSLREDLDITSGIIAALIVSIVVGLCMLALVVRNRAYFVHMTRYLNEQRELFLKYKPLGFENKCEMYTDCSQPPFFNWRSSQSWIMYIVSALNSTLIGLLFFVILASKDYKWVVVVISSILLFIIQLVITIVYLLLREKKSASKSIFGKEKSKLA